jgi:hypothetical protein
MRAIAAVLLLFAGHRNPFVYVEPPVRPVVVKKTVAPETGGSPPIVIEARKEIARKPEPPSFPYRCIGRFGPDANPFAVFDGGGAIINVRAGEVIDEKFTVRAIGIESVTISVEGFPAAEQHLAIGSE